MLVCHDYFAWWDKGPNKFGLLILVVLHAICDRAALLCWIHKVSKMCLLMSQIRGTIYPYQFAWKKYMEENSTVLVCIISV